MHHPQEPDPLLPGAHRGQEQRLTEHWYRMAGLGAEFIVAVLLVGALGWWLDHVLGTLPWLTLVGAALGFAVGLWMMLRVAFRSFKH